MGGAALPTLAARSRFTSSGFFFSFFFLMAHMHLPGACSLRGGTRSADKSLGPITHIYS